MLYDECNVKIRLAVITAKNSGRISIYKTLLSLQNITRFFLLEWIVRIGYTDNQYVIGFMFFAVID